MNNRNSSRSLLSLYIAAGVLALVGWVGVLALIFYTVPIVEARWMFFLLATALLTGTAVPFIRYLNRRFERRNPTSAVLLRRALWIGVLGVTMAWLQIGRSLSWGSGLLLAGVFIGIEWLLEMRDRSRYRSRSVDDR